MFIDFLHRFVIDHINCYYFRLMTYSIRENKTVRPRVRLDNRNLWKDKMLCSVPIDQTSILSYDVASERKITPCNKIDNPLVVCNFKGNVLMCVTTLCI